MFGWFNRREDRLPARMAALTRVAQMVTYTAIVNDLGFNDGRSEDEKATISARAAARTNFLFGNEPAKTHNQFDLALEHRSASDWLAVSPLFRELVVQTLRVIFTVRHGTTGSSAIVREDVLVKHGREFPDAPNPTEYPLLVQRAIGTLTDSQQVEISEWEKRGSPT
jgi:hypothetical protein